MADLWAYDPAIAQWALMHGTSALGVAPVYGTMGIPGPAVTPGEAQYGHPAWVSGGRLWMYGNNSSSDMWCFDPAIGQWAWMNGYGGFSGPVYGTLGIPAVGNSPGNVNETDAKWVDDNGDLWLFNDLIGTLWKYTLAINQWTWINGTPGAMPSVGALGAFSATNQPGANANCPALGTLWTMWHDQNDGLWMLYNRDLGVNVEVQLWKYDITLGQWATMRIDAFPWGTTTQSYGTQCVEDATHAPFARSEVRARWVDDCQRLWIFGGIPMCVIGPYAPDMWRYDPASNNWTWIAGNMGSTVNLGTQGVPSPVNWPDPNAGAFHWESTDGFWMYGGNSNSSDAGNMFRYMPDSIIADFAFVVDALQCQHVDFTDASDPGCDRIQEYAWDFGDPASGANNTSAAADPAHDFTSSGAFTVTLTVKNCTWDADTIQQQVIITCTTTASLLGDTICAGECATLTAIALGGSAPYSFAWDNGITSTNAGPITVCPATTTTYTVIVTDSLFASDTATATITVLPPPLIDLGPDTIACDAPLQLDAGTVTGVTWQDGSTGQFFSVNANGLYWAEVDNGVCVRRDTISVTFSGPVVDLGPDTVTCSPLFLLDAGASPAQYTWQDGSTGQTFQVDAPGTYWVQVTDSAGCTAVDTLMVSLDSVSVDLGPDQFICIGEQMVLDAQNTGATYLWQDGSTGQQFATGSTGNYSVQVDEGLCHDADTVNITAYLPNAVALASDTAGCPPLQIQFTDASTTPFGTITNWFWQFGDMSQGNAQNPVHIYTAPGVYFATLMIATDDGCMDADSAQAAILVYPIPGVDFVFDPPNATMENATIHFTDNSIGATAWEWDFGDGSTSTEQNPDHTYMEAGTYTVQLDVMNEYGCLASTTYTLVITGVSSIYIPNAFTPNGDGINDVFRVEGEGIAELELSIFNRWGEMIFDGEELERGWDGEYHEVHVQDGVYIWKVRYKTIERQGWQQATGHVTVLR